MANLNPRLWVDSEVNKVDTDEDGLYESISDSGGSDLNGRWTWHECSVSGVVEKAVVESSATNVGIFIRLDYDLTLGDEKYFLPVSAGGAFRFEIPDIAAGGRDWIMMAVQADLGATIINCYFDVTNGVVGSFQTTGDAHGLTAWMEPSSGISGSPYKCVMEGWFETATEVWIAIYMADSDGDASVDGLGGTGVTLGGPPVFTVWDEYTDMLLRHPISIERGIQGSGPTELVGAPESLSFVLDNSEGNSAGLKGYYSPAHTNRRTGFIHGTRIRLTVGPFNAVDQRTRFVGWIDSIEPSPGPNGSRETACVAQGFFSRLTEYEDVRLELQESVGADDLWTALLAALPFRVEQTDFQTGVSTFDFAFDDLGGERQSAISVGQNVNQSEYCKAYPRFNDDGAEVLYLESRTTPSGLSIVESFDGSEMRAADGTLSVPASTDRIVNDIELSVFPRRVGTSAEVLFQFDAPIAVDAGASVVRTIDYRDPDNEAKFIGGKDIVTPVSTTDYTANSASGGGGTDLTADFSIAVEDFGSSARLTITNSGGTNGYLRGPGSDDGARLRGTALRRYAPVLVPVSDDISIADFGRRPLRFQMPYQEDDNVAESIAALILKLRAGLGSVPTYVEVNASVEAVRDKAVVLEVGDKITVTETQCGVNANAQIVGIHEEIGDGTYMLGFDLAPIDSTQALIIEDSTYGIIGQYAPGYG